MADDLKNEEFKLDRLIEVTEAMVEAGRSALLDEIGLSGRWDGTTPSEVAELVFRAMIRHLPQEPR